MESSGKSKLWKTELVLSPCLRKVRISELERLLFEWFMAATKAGTNVNNETLLIEARSIGDKVGAIAGLKYSLGWLNIFKKHYSIMSFKKAGISNSLFLTCISPPDVVHRYEYQKAETSNTSSYGKKGKRKRGRPKKEKRKERLLAPSEVSLTKNIKEEPDKIEIPTVSVNEAREGLSKAIDFVKANGELSRHYLDVLQNLSGILEQWDTDVDNKEWESPANNSLADIQPQISPSEDTDETWMNTDTQMPEKEHTDETFEESQQQILHDETTSLGHAQDNNELSEVKYEETRSISNASCDESVTDIHSPVSNVDHEHDERTPDQGETLVNYELENDEATITFSNVLKSSLGNNVDQTHPEPVNITCDIMNVDEPDNCEDLMSEDNTYDKLTIAESADEALDSGPDSSDNEATKSSLIIAYESLPSTSSEQASIIADSIDATPQMVDFNMPPGRPIGTPGSAARPHICSICNKGFMAGAVLRNHMLIHTDIKPFACEKCDKRFRQKSNLNTHVRKIHSETPSEYICTVCGKVLKSANGLTSHMNIHDGKKPFSCHICEKAHTTKQMLQKHMFSHTGEKRFMCDVCGKAYVDKRPYIIHLRSHSGEKPFSCKECGKKFRNKMHMERHVFYVHVNIREHKCEICGFAFKDTRRLKCHMVIHTGERPYICPDCGKTFAHRATLFNHKKMHLRNKMK